MPKVGKKKFPYNSKGIAAAQAESKATGQEMEVGEGVNVARDAALSKSEKKDDKKSKKPAAKKKAGKGFPFFAKKANPFAKKVNPFAKKGG